MLRPASWLALLSRTFTFELSLAGSPQANVEYNYVDKQSTPTTGLSPASPTTLWAAELGLTPGTHQVESASTSSARSRRPASGVDDAFSEPAITCCCPANRIPIQSINSQLKIFIPLLASFLKPEVLGLLDFVGASVLGAIYCQRKGGVTIQSATDPRRFVPFRS